MVVKTVYTPVFIAVRAVLSFPVLAVRLLWQLTLFCDSYTDGTERAANPDL